MATTIGTLVRTVRLILRIILSNLLRIIRNGGGGVRLSTKGQYAVRAMLVLTMRQAEAPIALRRISELEDISAQYLEQIFVDLRKAKLVEGVRGASGGYRLARPADQITAGDILRAVEGPIAPVECVQHGDWGACERANICITRELWKRLRDSMSAVLDTTTLADLAAGKLITGETKEV